MKKIKKIVAVLLSLSVVVWAAACNANKGNSSSSLGKSDFVSSEITQESASEDESSAEESSKSEESEEIESAESDENTESAESDENTESVESAESSEAIESSKEVESEESETSTESSFEQEERTEFTVYLNANGGLVSITQMQVRYGESVQLPKPTKSGMFFMGWQIEGTKTFFISGSAYEAKEDMHLIAVWSDTDWSTGF